MKTKEKIRKYYEKPRINEVKLEIEEAVLTACKVSVSAVGSGTKTCNTTGNRCKSSTGS